MPLWTRLSNSLSIIKVRIALFFFNRKFIRAYEISMPLLKEVKLNIWIKFTINKSKYNRRRLDLGRYVSLPVDSGNALSLI